MSDWVSRQEKAMCRWVSLQIGRAISQDLSSEISDGLLLILLVNKLVDNYKLPPVHQDPQSRLQKIENIADCLQFIKFVLELNIDHISAENIADKNRKLILGLVWMLFLYLTRTSLQKVLKSDCDSFLKIKVFLRDWINIMIRRKGLGEITNFDRDWLLETSRPDLFFAAILEYYLGSDIDYAQLQSGPKLTNMNHIFEIAETLGIPHLVDSDDFASLVPDEKCVVSYLLEWLKMFELDDDELIDQQSPTPSAQETMHEIFLKEAGKAEEEKSGRMGSQDKKVMNPVEEVAEDSEDNILCNQKSLQRLKRVSVPISGTIEQIKRMELKKELQPEQKNDKMNQNGQNNAHDDQNDQMRDQSNAVEQLKVSSTIEISNPEQAQATKVNTKSATKKAESVRDIPVELYDENESTTPKGNPTTSEKDQIHYASREALPIVEKSEPNASGPVKPLKIDINQEMKNSLILKEFKSPFDDDFDEEIVKLGSVPVLRSVESAKSKVTKSDDAIEAIKSEEIISEASEPEAIESGAIKPEAAKPEAAKPEAAKPEAAKPEAAKPEATEPKTTNSVAKPDTVNCTESVEKSVTKYIKRSVNSNKELPALPTDETIHNTREDTSVQFKVRDMKQTEPQQGQQHSQLNREFVHHEGGNISKAVASGKVHKLVLEESDEDMKHQNLLEESSRTGFNKGLEQRAILNANFNQVDAVIHNVDAKYISNSAGNVSESYSLLSQVDSERSTNDTDDFADGEYGFTEPTEELDNAKAVPVSGSPYTPKVIEQESDLDKTPFFEEEIKQLHQQHMREIKPKILTLQQNLRNMLSETETLTNTAYSKEGSLDTDSAETKCDDFSISSTKASGSMASSTSEPVQIPIATSSPVLKVTSPDSKPKEITLISTKSSWKKLIAVADEQTQDLIKVTQQFSADSIETMIAQLNDCFISIRATIDTGKADIDAMLAIASIRDSFDNLEVNLAKYNRMSGSIRASFDQGPDLYTEEFLQSLERLLDTAEQFSMHSLIGICLLSSELIDVEEYEIGLARVIQNKFPFIKTNEKDQLIKVQKGFSEVLAQLKTLSDNYHKSKINEFISGLKKQFEAKKDKVLISPGFVVGRRLDMSLTKSSSDFSIFYSDTSATSSLFDSPNLKPA